MGEVVKPEMRPRWNTLDLKLILIGGGGFLNDICFAYAGVPCNLENSPVIYNITNDKDRSIIEFKDGTCIVFSNGKVVYNKIDGSAIKPSEDGIFIE